MKQSENTGATLKAWKAYKYHDNNSVSQIRIEYDILDMPKATDIAILAMGISTDAANSLVEEHNKAVNAYDDLIADNKQQADRIAELEGEGDGYKLALEHCIANIYTGYSTVTPEIRAIIERALNKPKEGGS